MSETWKIKIHVSHITNMEKGLAYYKCLGNMAHDYSYCLAFLGDSVFLFVCFVFSHGKSSFCKLFLIFIDVVIAVT